MSDYSNTLILKDVKFLKNKSLPIISLPNQEGSLLRLHRIDTFRMILYFFPMTGRPDRPLPENWNNIPGERRHKNRKDTGPRNINEDLVNKIKSLS